MTHTTNVKNSEIQAHVRQRCNLVESVCGDKKLIVSLTSYPPRMVTTHIPILAILRNTVQPDKVILWLAKSQFPNELDDIPQKVLDIMKSEPRFEIRFVDEDTKQFKKLKPALKEFPDDFIITVDDDRKYSKRLISKLLKQANKHPGCVITARARYVKVGKDGVLNPFNKFSKHSSMLIRRPRFCYMSIGNTGILYPPKCFHPDIYDKKLFEQVNPKSDDLWNWAMEIRAGTKIKIASPFSNPRVIRGTTKIRLGRERDTYLNDGTKRKVKHTYVDTLVEFFPELVDIIRGDQ